VSFDAAGIQSPVFVVRMEREPGDVEAREWTVSWPAINTPI